MSKQLTKQLNYLDQLIEQAKRSPLNWNQLNTIQQQAREFYEAVEIRLLPENTQALLIPETRDLSDDVDKGTLECYLRVHGVHATMNKLRQ